MSQVFANTIDNNPIYAARAEADEDGLNLKHYYAKIADLAAVAFSGSYNDLTNTPSIPTKTSDLTNDSGFITASDIPAIPTKTSDLTNDSGFITASDIPAQVNADWNESDPSDPAYIENKPTIPVVPATDQTYDASSANPQSGTAVAGALATVRQVPASTSSDADKVLTVDSLGVPSWAVVPSQSTGLFEAVYGTTTYADIVQAIADKKIVYCRISGSNPTRMAFLAYIGPGNTGNIEFQYYRSNTSGDDSVFVYACTSASVWSTAERTTGIKTQVKSDWNANSGAAQILNKPDMSLYALISSLSTVATSGSYLDLTDLPTISNVPAVTSTDDGKVLKASYSGGTGSYSWETAPSGLPASTSADEGKVLKVDANGDPEWDTAPASQVQADWTESDTTDPSYIQNKPTEQALVAGQGITITEANNQVTIGCNVQAPVQDVTYGGSSVVNAQGVAEIPAPSYPVTDVTMDGTSVLSNGVAALTSEVEILAYGSTGAWAKFTEAITAGKSVFCRVNPSGNNYRFVPLSYYNINEGTAEFNFHRATPTKNYTTQCDELYVYSLSSSGTWATTTKNVALKYLAGVGLDKATVTNDSITFSVKPKTGGGVNVDSNGVSVDVKEAPSDGKEYVRKNGAWVESSGAVETVLFSNPAGLSIKNNNLVLSETASNFDRVKFIYRSNDGYQRSVDIIPSATLKVDLANIDPMTNGMTYVKAVTLLSSDGITWTINAGPTEWQYKSADGTSQRWGASGNVIYIIKVIGIKNGVNLYNIDKGRTVLYTGTPTNEVTNMSLNPFDYDELKLFLHIGTVDRIYSLGLKGNTSPFQLVVKVYDGASNLWERWIQLTFTTNSVTVNATKRYKLGTITDNTTTPSDVRYSTSASDLQFISKIIGFNY